MSLRNMKFIDLFAGIGGFRYALESFGAKCVFSCEKDKFAIESYLINHGEVPAGDISKIKREDIPEHNILCAGFPCQAFSISGNQEGFNDKKNGILFFDIYRIAQYHKPEILFLENVAGLKSHNDRKTIELMINLLENLGYIVNCEVLNASDYNVPQTRKRVYFVCFNKEKLPIYNFKYPEKEKCTKYLEDILEKNIDNIEDYEIKRTDIFFKEDFKSLEVNKADSIRIGTINKGGQGDRIYSPKGHAITLSAQGGGSGSKTGAYLIDGVVRKLTPKECARLQGFPEEYKIVVSDNQAYKQFGNSVAIPVLKKILNEINKCIDLYNRSLRS